MLKHSKLVIGLMSGTSLDGIDAVLLRIRGNGTSTKFKQLAFISRPYPNGLKRLLLKNSVPATSRVDEIARLSFLLAGLYADAVNSLARRAGKKLSQIDLIGSHGQTIQHLPNPHSMFGKAIRSTLQIGDPSVLATITGITTVGDFRVADMAVGGQGAPLVPYVDWLAFRSTTHNRLLLNIGGIANMTVLPMKCSADEVIAFDTGPGNMLVDALMQRFYKKPFDKNGRTAAGGMISGDILHWCMKHPYFSKQPPKSTGREEFGKRFLDRLLTFARHYNRQDIVATVSHLTCFAVHDAYTRFVERRVHVDEVIVSGGGAKNRFFIDDLRRHFGDSVVMVSDELGMSSQAKEAICFAIHANETLAGHQANLPRVTGAKRRVVLGKICRPVI